MMMMMMTITFNLHMLSDEHNKGVNLEITKHVDLYTQMGRSFILLLSPTIRQLRLMPRRCTGRVDKQLWSFLAFGSGWRCGVSVMPCSLSPRDIKLPTPDVQNSGWAPDPVWTVGAEQHFCSSEHHNPNSPGV
jgi:hypothetical protein